MTSEASHLISREDMETKAERSGYPDWVANRLLPHIGRRVCDLGAGHGSLAQHLLDKEKVLCVDFEKDALSTLRDRFNTRDNVEILEYDLNTRPLDLSFLKDRAIDTVVSTNVFEHLEDDISVAKSVWRELPIGGRLVLFVPAHQMLFCRIDERCLHQRRYDRPTLERLYKQAGFRLQKITAFNLPGYFIYAYQGKIARRSAGFFESVEPNRVGFIQQALSVYRQIEDRIGTPLGLSWIAIGVKDVHTS